MAWTAVTRRVRAVTVRTRGFAMTAALLAGFSIVGPVTAGGAAAGQWWSSTESGWSQAESSKFWWTPQGSEIIPYDWFIALEGLDGLPLADPGRMAGMGYIIVGKSDANPDNLPIGFTRGKGSQGKDWLGLNCAACHTGELRLGARRMIIEGGPGHGDYQAFNATLLASMKATYANPEAFAAFAARLGRSDVAALREEFARELEFREFFTRINSPKPSNPYGYGRVDALGIIVNNVAAIDAGVPANAKTPDAPVNYPFIWGSPYLDYVQYNAAVDNLGPGALGRNIGQVLGVYGRLDMKNTAFPLGYKSSVKVDNLLKIEELVRKVQSPVWPEDMLPPIDRDQAAMGEGLYAKYCASCHAVVPRGSTKIVNVNIMPLSKIGTDPATATNFANRLVDPGYATGRRINFVAGPPFKNPAKGPNLLRHAVTGVALQHVGDTLLAVLENTAIGGTNNTLGLLVYKGRPLNGIWATAPYLHNGSVANLEELLKKPSERASQFQVIPGQFDPTVVGIPVRTHGAGFTFDTRKPGNSAAGHAFGTNLKPEEKRALIEYMKTL